MRCGKLCAFGVIPRLWVETNDALEAKLLANDTELFDGSDEQIHRTVRVMNSITKQESNVIQYYMRK